MVFLSHLATSATLMAALGVFIAALLIDRWYVTTEDSLSTLYGLQEKCERNDCADYSFDDGTSLCPYSGGKHQSIHNASLYFYYITMGLTGLSGTLSFVTACLAADEAARIKYFGAIMSLTLLAAVCSTLTGGLFYYLVRELLFCGSFCDFARFRNVSVSCFATFGTSFALWGLGTTLLFAAALFGSILRLVDKGCLRAAEEKKKQRRDTRKNNRSNAYTAPTHSQNPVSDSGFDSPHKRYQEPQSKSGEEQQEQGRDEGANEWGHTGVPEGYIYDEETAMYWSDADTLYYDPVSTHYYDPNSFQWYNPETEDWYEEKEETGDGEGQVEGQEE